MNDIVPLHQHNATCGCYQPDAGGTYYPVPLQQRQQQSPQIIQHIHQAAPDRTVQRLALGSGVGAGTVAAGVYFGPLLVGALTAITANLAVLALLISVSAWGVVTVVRSVGGKAPTNAVSRKP